MNKVFTSNGWEDYIYWQTEDKKTLKKINTLLKDIEGIGKPEPLIGNLSGFWSRRINEKDRLIYKIDEYNIYILSCRYHYSDTQWSELEDEHNSDDQIGDTEGCC